MSPNHILRLVFGLQKIERVSKVKEDLNFFNAPELHLHELFKVISRVFWTIPSHFLNEPIYNFDFEKFLYKEARKTELKLLIKLTTNNKKHLLTRVRKILNALAKLNVKIIKNFLMPHHSFPLFYVNLGIIAYKQSSSFETILVGVSTLAQQVPAYLNVSHKLIVLMH